MKIAFVYPSFERHAESHPELRQYVPCNEYLGPPSLGIAAVAAMTPPGHDIVFIDDRITRFDPADPKHDADLYALSFFTPAATRGMEIGDQLLKLGKPVVMGGIFPSMMPDEVQSHCTSVVVGEGEPVWATIVEDALAQRLRPRYVSSSHGDLGAYPPPRLDLYLGSETAEHQPDDYPLQLARGCPLSCNACVLPAHMGRVMRFQSDANLIAAMRQLTAAGKLISFTEDTSVTFAYGARRRFRAFLEMVLELQAKGLAVRFSYLGISMPMILHLPDEFFALLRATGMDRFYLVGGFDPITRKAFGVGDKSALAKATQAIGRCHDEGIKPYVSFLMGNPDDDEGVFDRMVDFGRSTKIDLAEFCVSTPYPGTPLWHQYTDEGRMLGRPWKYFNDANVTFRPHHMSPERLEEGYLYAWREFYGGRQEDLGEREHLHRTIQF